MQLGQTVIGAHFWTTLYTTKINTFKKSQKTVYCITIFILKN